MADDGIPMIPDPPTSATKWIDLVKNAVALGLVPFLLLAYVTWRDSRREDKSDKNHETVVMQMREDLKAQQAATDKVLDRLLSMVAVQQADTKKDIKDVKSEVRATADVVKAAVPAVADSAAAAVLAVPAVPAVPAPAVPAPAVTRPSAPR